MLSLRKKYLGYIRDIAMGYQSLLPADVKKDTRKRYSTEYPSMGPFGSRPRMLEY